MTFAKRCVSLIVLLLVLGPPAAVQAQHKPFAHQGVAKDAERYEAWLKANWPPGNRKPRDLKLAGERLLTTDARAASRNFGMAVVADDKDVQAWIGLARALLAIAPDANVGSERYELPLNASAAAYIAAQRATTPALKSAALAVLGETLKRRSYWRPAIDAFKASLDLVDSAEVRKTYETLRAEHGFRFTDYKIESDAAAPRVCLEFSERLAEGPIDFAKFVSVGGKDPQNVSADGKQLCIDGFAHGQRFEVQLRSGVPAVTDEVLEKPVELGFYVRDRTPSVRFTGRSYVLPSGGQQGIPVVTVNSGSVAIEIYRIGDRGLASRLSMGDTRGDDFQRGDFQRQIAEYDLERYRSRVGAKVYEGTLAITPKLNEEVTTAVPVSEAVPQLKPGVYVMVAKPAEQKSNGHDTLATQWFIVSDLGLTAFSGDDGVHAFVRSLASAEGAGGVSVRLVARNNEVLGTARTDANGYAHFERGLSQGEGGSAPALLVAETAADYAFLDLAGAAFDLTDRGVKGREAPGPLDVFLYTERGVYRPAEDVHVTALVRNRAGKAASVPMVLILTRPDGVEDRRITLPDQGLGGRTASLKLAPSAMTGTWRVKLHTDPKADPVTAAAFLVEDFVPERLELKLAPAAAALAPETIGTINVTGRYLYGPPAANLALEGEIVVKPSAKDVEGLAGYRFGLADEKIRAVRAALEGLPATNAEGAAAVPVTLPAVPRTARPLEADVLLRLREPGGRAIERKVTLPVDLKQPRIGVKPLFADSGVGEGDTAAFDVVLLDAAGQRAARAAFRWELYRLDQNWQWYRRDGQWTYEAVTHARKSANGTARAEGGAPARIAAKVDWGRYRLDVAAEEAGGPVSSVAFTAGWFADAAADSPETLDVALDQAGYRPGQTAKLKIASRQGGRALVAVLGSGLLAQKHVEVPAGGGEVGIEVGAGWGAGVYVAAMLYRAMDETAKRMPARAVGLKWLALDQSERTLKVALDVPAKVKSGGPLPVPIRLAGLAAGEEARVTLAAVDAGILNLTRYQAPAPEDWFHAQRRLGVEIRDFYGRLIDGMRAERGKLRFGGDVGIGGLSTVGSPPVEATLALFSGIVTVGSDGTAKVDFALPDFNGTVRLMAVAWSADKVGHGTADVIVRDAVALTVAGPRFLTLGDEARLELDVHNVEGPKGTYKVTLKHESETGAKGPIVARDIVLEQNERSFWRLPFAPQEIGRVEYDVRVTGPDGLAVKRRLTFDVKPPAGDIKRSVVSRLAVKGGTITLSSDLLHDLIPSRTKVAVNVGPHAALDVPALLIALDRYPYGCAEQTVSRALPLLYAGQLAAGAGLGTDTGLRERVQGAIDRVFEMQSASGAFGAWGPGSTDIWLTSFVSDFLTRAKEAGYAVKPQAFAQALDRLQNYVGNAQDFEKGGEARAYALYVLARNGRAPIGELRYYVDDRLGRFATPLAQAQLGAALAMLGDRERAETAFAAALAALNETDAGASRLDYGSGLRDGAAVLALAAETKAARSQAPKLADVIAKAYAARAYTSTQEQAWLLLAAKELSDQAKDVLLSVNGTPHRGQLRRALLPSALERTGLVIRNEGEAAVDAVVSVVGAALTPEPSVSKGFKIERSFYTLDGKAVSLDGAAGDAGRLKQTDRLVVVLKVEATEAGGRVLLVDRLPAGLEIENPRLVDSGDVKSLDWLKTTTAPEHTEFRSDRFVAAFNFFGKGGGAGRRNPNAEGDSGSSEAKGAVSAATVAYMVRAVTPGTFIHPAATVEDMYRPERHARTAAGRLEVTAKE